MRRVWISGGVVLALAGAAVAAVPGPPRAITDPKSVVSEQKMAAPPAVIADLYANTSSLGAAWTPDGQWGVVSANLSGRVTLWKSPTAGGPTVQLTKSNDRQSDIVVSP